jgi:hypothetical protein
MIAISSSGCASTLDYVTGEPRFNRFSIEDEADLGTREATLMLASTEMLGLVTDPDTPATRLAQGIASRILAVPENRARMPPFLWEIHVVQDQTTNAWTFPGGQLVLMAGLFDQSFVLNEDEAAALIGHEIAHAALRHSTERRSIEGLRDWLEPLGRFFGPRLVEVLAPGGPRDAMRALSKTASDFDQSQEIEADLIGLELMARAGFDPSSASELWRRHRSLGPTDPLSTHPSSEERSHQLELHLPVARYVVSRMVSTPPRATPPAAGARIGPRVLHADRSLLELRVRVFTAEHGAAPRAAIRLLASKDLAEDRLPFSAVLFVESDPLKPALAAIRLARQVSLADRSTEMRVALPRLPAGSYRARARVMIGAIETETTERFEIEP